MNNVHIHPEVAQALSSGQPVVALESAVITCGLPREPFTLPAGLRQLAPQWNDRNPLNIEIARAMSNTVRDGGAVPALVAVIDGSLRIGMDDAEMKTLARNERAEKASAGDLASVIADGKTAGTTVSATLTACRVASEHSQSHRAISVFATGGIGGVHRDWTKTPDISADLRAIGSTPVCVVSAGAKSILDLPATLEALQMLGVPVVGYQTDWFPQFHLTGEPASAGSGALRSNCLPLNHRIDDPKSAAHLCHTHWQTLGLRTGVLLCNPIPREFAVDQLEIDLAIAEAERLAKQRRITGPDRTPFLLAEIARLTDGRSLTANIALLLNNAKFAAQVALAMSTDL